MNRRSFVTALAGVSIAWFQRRELRADPLKEIELVVRGMT